MKRTLLYTLLSLGLLYGGLPLLYPLGSDKRDFFAAFDPKWRAQAALPSPRILLVGGSNGLFGVDSKQLEQALGIPVYNLCLQADLGIPFFLDMTLAAARPGDIVLFSPEYRCRSGSTRTRALLQLESPELGSLIQADAPEQVRLATQRVQITAAGLVNTLLFDEHAYSKVYRSDGFDRWGDLHSADTLPREDYPLPPPMDTVFASEAAALAAFCPKAQARGIRFFYLPQAYPQKGYRQDSTALTYITKTVRRMGWPLLCAPETMIFADTLFFDSPNHVTVAGRRTRTRLLTTYLRPIVVGIE